jgi:glycosyltransferase involved in cell wall biosynthesis
VILTRNEERNLPRTLDSLPPGIELLVVDHESTDATAALARERGARVITRPFTGFVDARLFALGQVRTAWTLMLDADEAPDERLRDAVLSAPEDVDAYRVSRTTYYCGKPMRMWSGERLIRLFRTDRIELRALPAAGGEAQLHERWICTGSTADLNGTLHHYSYPDAASYRARFDEYTSTESAGIRPDRGAALRESAFVPLRLVNALVRRGAVLDGPRGWTVAWYSALYPAVVRWKSLGSG